MEGLLAVLDQTGCMCSRLRGFVVAVHTKRKHSVDRLHELLSQDSSLGLPLGLEAPVMTPNGVTFLFFSC